MPNWCRCIPAPPPRGRPPPPPRGRGGGPPPPPPGPTDPAELEPLAAYQPGRPTPRTTLHRTERYELFWSLSFALDRSSWDRIGGFDERYVGYGGEDTDFARRAERANVPIWFAPGPQAFHQYHPVSSPPVEHLRAICRNATIFFETWGSWPMEGWLSAFAAEGLIEWTPFGDRCAPLSRLRDVSRGRGDLEPLPPSRPSAP
ncbi:MAG: galactosyltransferase-related protein [Ilumatobacter sp.]